MYRCECCGNIWQDSELDGIQDRVGEYHGQPAYEYISVCPHCYSDELTEVREMEDKDMMYNYILMTYDNDDIINVMVELLGDTEETYEKVYALLNRKNPDIHADKDYVEYACEHCWEVV